MLFFSLKETQPNTVSISTSEALTHVWKWECNNSKPKPPSLSFTCCGYSYIMWVHGKTEGCNQILNKSKKMTPMLLYRTTIIIFYLLTPAGFVLLSVTEHIARVLNTLFKWKPRINSVWGEPLWLGCYKVAFKEHH